jgi:hypothetical protein
VTGVGGPNLAVTRRRRVSERLPDDLLAGLRRRPPGRNGSSSIPLRV